MEREREEWKVKETGKIRGEIIEEGNEKGEDGRTKQFLRKRKKWEDRSVLE